MKKRFLSIMMALCLALSLLPATALATEEGNTGYEDDTAAAAAGMVARIGEQGTEAKYYDKLKDAVGAAKNGETITLVADIKNAYSADIEDGRSLKLDLNGYDVGFAEYQHFNIYNGGLNITGSGELYEEEPYYAPVLLYGSNDADDESYTTVTVGEQVTLRGWAGLFIDQKEANSGGDNAYGIVATVYGTLESVRDTSGAGGHALYINGTIKGTDGENVPQIVLNRATLKTAAGNGMYLAGYAETTITDSTIISNSEGSTGIEIRAGKLTINGNSSVQGGTGKTDITPNGNGSTTNNVALAVVQHTTKLPTEVKINGGTFIGGAALFEQNAQSNDNEAVAKIKIEVNSGNFTGQIFSQNKTGFITGGTFSSGVAEYVAENKYSVGQENGTFTIRETTTAIKDNAGNYYVSEAAAQAGSTASVTTEEGTTSYYTSLSAAIAAATSGDTIDLWKDVTASNADLSAYTDAVYELPAGVTLDGNKNRIIADAENWGQISGQSTSNHILSVESGPDKTTIQNLTIIGVNEDGKASKAGIHAYNGAVVDIANVTIEDCGSVGVQVNGATVTATGLNVSGSGWGSVNVDRGSASVAPNFTFNSGNLEDDVQIYSENPEGTTITVNDVYQEVQGGDGDLDEKVYYTTDPAKLGEATVTKDGETTVYTDLDNALSSENAPSGSTVTVVKDATLHNDATIVSGVTFVVDDGVELTIANGKTLTNNGTIENNGTITGTVTTGESGKATAQVTFVTTPSDATVTVTGQGSGKTYNLPDDTYSYTVSANGYYSKTGNFTVSGNAQTITVKLEQIPTSSSGSSSSEPSYSPVMDVSKGGSVKVNPRTPGEGDEVTITVDPDSGYEVDDVTVTDRNGREVKVTAERDGTYTFTQPRGRVTISVTFVREGGGTFFSDVPESFWAYDEIAWAYDNGSVNGTSASAFSPNASISRQQVWMILARLSGADPANMSAAREWAVTNGVSDGTTPGGAVTRQQLVALLYRYATLMGYANDQRADLSAYPDAGTVAGYAVEPMQWSVANSIVGGTSNGTLDPTGTATRAQFAVILYRFWDQVG